MMFILSYLSSLLFMAVIEWVVDIDKDSINGEKIWLKCTGGGRSW